MNYAQLGRDFNGRIDINGFLKIVDIYSEMLDLDSFDKKELLDYFSIVSKVEEKSRKNKSLEKMKNSSFNKNVNFIGKKKR